MHLVELATPAAAAVCRHRRHQARRGGAGPATRGGSLPRGRWHARHTCRLSTVGIGHMWSGFELHSILLWGRSTTLALLCCGVTWALTGQCRPKSMRFPRSSEHRTSVSTTGRAMPAPGQRAETQLAWLAAIMFARSPHSRPPANRSTNTCSIS